MKLTSPLIFSATVLLAIVALTVLAWRWDVAACQDKGGQLRSFSGVGPVVSAQGGVAITTTTICISVDGRIL